MGIQKKKRPARYMVETLYYSGTAWEGHPTWNQFELGNWLELIPVVIFRLDDVGHFGGVFGLQLGGKIV